MDIEELKKKIPTMTREQKLEVMAKAGVMLRKELEDDFERSGKVEFRARLCKIEIIKQYDAIMDALKGKS